jgi:hypothetical protein
MALNLSTVYSSQVDTDPTHYPLGKARNVTTAGAGDGTPFEKRWLNDLWGFLQALLANATITASGTEDTADVSQYLAAVEYVAAHAPKRIIESAQVSHTAGIDQTVTSASYVALDNSSLPVTATLLVGDKVKYWYTQLWCSNLGETTSGTSVRVRAVQDVGGTNNTSTAQDYAVPHDTERPLLICGEFTVSEAGYFALFLDAVSNPSAGITVTGMESTHVVGYYEVTRP